MDNNKVKKIIIIINLLVFLCQNTCWPISVQKKHLSFPKLATEHTIPTVILIEDAHCVYEAQKNIARILEEVINGQGIGLVCVEGAAGNIDPALFSSFPDSPARERACDQFIKKGYLSGVEAVAISKGKELPFTLWGCEDQSLYIKDLNQFQKAVKLTEEIDWFIKQRQTSSAELSDNVINPQIKEFSKKQTAFNTGELPADQWLGYLHSRRPDLSYANFDLLIKSTQLEKLILAIGLMDVNATANLLFQYVQLGCQQPVNMEQLFAEELPAIEEQVAASLIRTEEEREIFQQSQFINLLVKLLHLQINRQEIEAFMRFDFPSMAMKIMEGNNYLLADLEEAVNAADEFYRLAQLREEALVNNTIKKMREAGKERVVLIAGGFHTRGLREKFQRQGINTLKITPQITAFQLDNPYLNVIMGSYLAPPLFSWRLYRTRPELVAELFRLMFVFAEKPLPELAARIKDAEQKQLFQEFVNLAGSQRSADVAALAAVLSPEDIIVTIKEIGVRAAMSAEEQEALFDYIFLCLRTRASLTNSSLLEQIKNLYDLLPEDSQGISGQLKTKLRYKLEAEPKVILVNFSRGSLFRSVKPLGLARISANLKENNIVTHIADGAAQQLRPEKLAVQVAERAEEMSGPIVIGVSILPGDIDILGEFLQSLPAELTNRKDVYICAGGYLPTMTAAEFMAKFPQISFIIRGEGEQALVNLINTINNGGSLAEVENLIYRDRETNEVKQNPRYHVLTSEKLNTLPHPDYSLLIGQDSRFLKKALIDTTRGCFGNCRFCGLRAFMDAEGSVTSQEVPAAKLYWRSRSVSKVVDEIEALHVKYGITGFDFVDDDFIGNNPQRAMAIAREIIARGLQGKINFWCLARAASVMQAAKTTMREQGLDYGKNALELLREAGLRMVFLDTESFDDEQLRFYRKGTKAVTNLQAIQELRSAGIETRSGLINFYRESTLAQVRKNIEAIAEHDLITAIPTPSSYLRIYKNTPLYDEYLMTGVELIPMGNDAFLCDIKRREVDFLFKKAKRIADKSYRMMMHFKELQEQKYYFPSAVADRAEKVYHRLKELEFGCFQQLFKLVSEAVAGLDESAADYDYQLDKRLESIDEQCSEIVKDSFQRMIDQVKIFNFNIGTEEDGYDAQYQLPNEKMFQDPIDRLSNILNAHGDAWVIFGDFLKLWNRNMVYDPATVNYFIKKVAGIADNICRQHGGFAAHLMADEVILSLPKELAPYEVQIILEDIQQDIYQHFSGRYGFASLKIPSGADEENVLQRAGELLKEDESFRVLTEEKLPIATRDFAVEDRYCLLIDLQGQDINAVLKRLNDAIRETGASLRQDVSVEIPWLPMGAVRAKHVSRNGRRDIRFWIDDILEQAEFVEERAKKENPQLIQVAGRKDLVSVEEEEDSLFTAEEMAELTAEVSLAQLFLNQRNYAVENKYPAYKKSSLGAVVGDTLYYAQQDVLLCRLDVGYELTDPNLLPRFEEVTITRHPRKGEEEKRVFGFKSVQGVYGRKKGGDDIIFLLNLWLHRKLQFQGVSIVRIGPDKFYFVFEKNDRGQFPTAEEICEKLADVKNEVSKILTSQLSVQVLFQLSMVQISSPMGPESSLAEIPKRKRDAYVGSAIKMLNLLSDIRREQAEGDFLDAIVLASEEGTEIRDFDRHPDPGEIHRQLKEREARSKQAMRRNSLRVLRQIREKNPPETVLQRTTPQKKPVILVFGYPAAGKSTVLAALQQQDAEICQISIGDIMRALLDPNPEFVMLDNERMIFNVLGRQLREDELQTGRAMLLANNPPFPAWKRIFDRFLEENNLYLAAVVNLTVSREIAIARMAARARPDEASPELRLANHERNVLPLVDYYRQAGYVIDFDNSADDLAGLPNSAAILHRQLNEKLQNGERQYREIILAEGFVNRLDYLNLSPAAVNQLTLAIADLIKRYQEGQISTYGTAAAVPVELAPEIRANLLRDITVLVSLFVTGDSAGGINGYLISEIIGLTEGVLLAEEKRLARAGEQQQEYPLAPVYEGSCSRGDKKLNIARYHYRGRTYVRIGSRLYETDKTVDGLNAKDLLADPLLWLGNAELIEYFGEDQINYPRQTTGPPGLRLVEWNEDLHRAFPEIQFENTAVIRRAYQRLQDPELEPLLRTHYSLIIYFFSITQKEEYTARDLHVVANISELHMNEFLYALLGTRQVTIPYIMSVQMRKLFRVLEKISASFIHIDFPNIRAEPANIDDPNLQNIVLNRLHYALNGLRYQDIVNCNDITQFNELFNTLLNRDREIKEGIDLFSYDLHSNTLIINLAQLAVEKRDERERLDTHIFRKRGPPEVDRDKVIVTALAYLCQKEQAGVVNKVIDSLRCWPQSWAADMVLKGIDANYKVELEIPQKEFLRDIPFGAGRAVWVLGGGCAEQELWIRRIVTDLFDKIKIMAGETEKGSPIINPNVDFGAKVQVPADCTALSSIDAYTWRKLRSELFSSEPLSEAERLDLQRRYHQAVWTTKVLIQKWIIEHDLQLLMFGQVALPEENPIFYPALLQAVEEVNALREPHKQAKVIIRHNYTNKRKKVREGIKIRVMKRDDPVEVFVESETNADLFEENFGFRPTVVHQAAHFPNVNLDSEVPLHEQVRDQEEFRKPVSAFRERIETTNLQIIRANAYLSFILNLFFDVVDRVLAVFARVIKMKRLTDFHSRIKYQAYNYKLKMCIDLENDIVIMQPSRIDANKMPESTVVMAKNIQRLENMYAAREGRKPRKVSVLFVGTQIRTGDEAGNFKAMEQEGLDNIWRTAKKHSRDDLDLRSQIHMLGQIPQEEVAAAYTFTDIVSIPSGHETFGRVPFEAYAVPVIYTRRWFYSPFYDQSPDREDIQVQYGLYGGLPLFNLRPGRTENGRHRPGPVQPEARDGEIPKLHERMYELLQSPERREQLTREKYLLTRRSEFNLANTARFLYYKFIAMFDHDGSRLRFTDRDFLPRRHEDSLDRIEQRIAAQSV